MLRGLKRAHDRFSSRSVPFHLPTIQRYSQLIGLWEPQHRQWLFKEVHLSCLRCMFGGKQQLFKFSSFYHSGSYRLRLKFWVEPARSNTVGQAHDIRHAWRLLLFRYIFLFPFYVFFINHGAEVEDNLWQSTFCSYLLVSKNWTQVVGPGGRHFVIWIILPAHCLFHNLYVT